MPDARHSPAETLESDERRWRIRVSIADFFQKILISIVGAAIAAVFYMYQQNVAQSRYYSDLQAQRERADADLRAKMFETLFEAYFKNKFDAARQAMAGGPDRRAQAVALLQNVGQEITLSDVLARNFETVDVRPLFEDLDRRLVDLIVDIGPPGSAPTPLEISAFRELQQLRRVAYGATARQTELLHANARAEVQQIRVEKCQTSPSAPPVLTPDALLSLTDAFVAFKRIEEGSVAVELVDLSKAGKANSPAVIESSTPRTVPFTVTYYDMPSLENVRLPDGRRLSLTLTSFLSSRTCERYWADMDESARLDCDALTDDLRTRGGSCSRAHIQLTLIPSDYISPRDRPYLSDLSSRGNMGFTFDGLTLLRP
jgi:hypothetical protein